MFKRLKSILIKNANDEDKRKYDITWKQNTLPVAFEWKALPHVSVVILCLYNEGELLVSTCCECDCKVKNFENKRAYDDKCNSSSDRSDCWVQRVSSGNFNV